MSEYPPGLTRRGFIGSVGATVAGAGVAGATAAPSPAEATPRSLPAAEGALPTPGLGDGPPSPLFAPVPFTGNANLTDLAAAGLSDTLRENAKAAPHGECVCWGIPFRVERVALARQEPITLQWPGIRVPWLVFMHTTDVVPAPRHDQGFARAPSGTARLRDHVADYLVLFADGSDARVPIWRQHQVGMLSRPWGANCFEAVAHRKPFPIRTTSEQPRRDAAWGWGQTRVEQPDAMAWVNWLWAWENPYPDRPVTGLRIEPKQGVLILSAITGGNPRSQPLRWDTRRKALLRLSEGEQFDPNLGGTGLSKHLQLDLGQVISVLPRTIYPNDRWPDTYNTQPPQVSPREILVEYTAHPDARFHLSGGRTIAVGDLRQDAEGPLTPIAPATQRVRLRVVEASTGAPVPVKLHAHGAGGEYLAPVDRHRIINPFWYEDWSVDYQGPGEHSCTYIPGEATLDLPIGDVYVEISKGFEIAPIRRVVRVTEAVAELSFSLEHVLPWRQQGWVTADTHVHFLSPTSAHLEGSAEGLNVVNLLASQWGELMTNVGDFDGRTTYGSRAAGGDGEHLVRVGTENRQHVLGHISLIGYDGAIIAPMTTGGPDEAALGDSVDILLTEWARQCRQQGGIVVLPHFPNPRAEHAAAIVSGEIDAVEMTSWSSLYDGIDPYSLSDWYRYLNCGHFVAAVGGTDKMSATTAVGTIRTYAKLPKDRIFDYEAWKQAVRAGHTFVTYGPLMEFAVDGKPPGTRIALRPGGGTMDIDWRVASVTVPMSRVELVVNGEIRESRVVDPRDDRGRWSVRVERSAWMALLVRGHHADRPEIIAAHSSPVMIEVEGTPFFSAADALTILHQIEGALAYLDTIGTRAETAVYQRMRLVLTGAHRSVHNRLHQQGVGHDHTPATNHAEHR